MDQSTLIAIAVAVLVLAAVGWLVSQRQRSEALRKRFGPEYERVANRLGDTRRAETELLGRQQRVAALGIRPLNAQQREQYQQHMRAVQTRFVDDPKGAVTDADELLEDVMKTRGYPVSEFGQRAADLSVHHPRAVDDYRAARDIAQRHRQGRATTEDLRQAMIHYRALFDDLLEDRGHAAERPREVASDPRANGDLEVKRTAVRDADGTEIPVKHPGERVSDILDDREVRP
jgi:hypothetical protein